MKWRHISGSQCDRHFVGQHVALCVVKWWRFVALFESNWISWFKKMSVKNVTSTDVRITNISQSLPHKMAENSWYEKNYVTVTLCMIKFLVLYSVTLMTVLTTKFCSPWWKASYQQTHKHILRHCLRNSQWHQFSKSSGSGPQLLIHCSWVCSTKPTVQCNIRCRCTLWSLKFHFFIHGGELTYVTPLVWRFTEPL